MKFEKVAYVSSRKDYATYVYFNKAIFVNYIDLEPDQWCLYRRDGGIFPGMNNNLSPRESAFPSFDDAYNFAMKHINDY